MGLKIRRDTAANWTSADPTLEEGEQGYETDTGKIKVGDGSTIWHSLAYWVGGGTPGDVTGPSSSVDSEVALFSSTTGKVIKRASGSGIAKLTSGVLSTVTAPSGTIVGTSDSQVLTNKDVTSGTNTFPTFNQNTSGTAANLSGTPALPNGTTATTQTAADNSTKLATTAYVDTGLGGKQPLDSDLTTIAGLTATTGNMILSVGSAWASQTPTQVKTALAIAVADVSGAAPLASPTFTGTVTLPTGLSGIAKLTSGAVSAVTAPSGAIVGDTDTQTLTNKRHTSRTGTTASSATPTINTDNVDLYTITALAANITSMTTNLSGTPNLGDRLMLRFKDDGTPRTISWGASFGSSGVATLLATTATSKTHHVGLMWDGSVWRCLAVDAVGY